MSIATEFFIYLAKVIAFQVVFILGYYTLLRKETFFSLNRAYLLISLMASFLLPGLTWEWSSPDNYWYEPMELVNSIAIPISDAASKVPIPTSNEPFSWFVLTEAFYWVVVLFLLSKYIFNLIKLNLNKNLYVETKCDKYTIYDTSLSHAFSFFNHIFLPQKWQGVKREYVMSHEVAHARKWHSIDRLLIECTIILLWFNPFIYLFRKAIIEVHEYEADAQVLKSYNRLDYQKVLVGWKLRPVQTSMVSLFNSLTKKRIIMMNQSKSKISKAYKYLLVVPVAIGMTFILSFRNAPVTSLSQLSSLAPPLMQKDYVPSILPVEGEARLRITSGYGMRLHPILQEKKFHRGIDIAAPRGTAIVATADGYVHETEYQPEGYGYFVWIKHGDTYATRYAQMEKYIVKKGEEVKKGQIIGYVGSSGRSTAPHLHYEISKNDKYVDPEGYIRDYFKK